MHRLDLVTLPVTTERLTLRLFTADDVDDMYAYQRLESVARYLYRPPHTRERCAEVIEKFSAPTGWSEDGDALLLALTRADEPGVIGDVVLKLADAHARQAEIGWTLHPAYEGRGYAAEAARALAALAFDELGAHRIFARLDVENIGSMKLCERLGMRREAHLVENDLDGERWGSEYIYAALAHDLKR
ncbi:GNAT family N-acetyltransferase [Streptomyces sp. NPDC048604]|uniref:GNAT family N-acetyltransferase n=1 Tax=Streptomyces sp. NPDC048604 TaxID=3365578 RepID=UPI00371A131D